jgi:hypothetical protein
LSVAASQVSVTSPGDADAARPEGAVGAMLSSHGAGNRRIELTDGIPAPSTRNSM